MRLLTVFLPGCGGGLPAELPPETRALKVSTPPFTIRPGEELFKC